MPEGNLRCSHCAVQQGISHRQPDKWKITLIFASNKKESEEIKGILEVEMYNFLKDFLYKTFNFSILLRDWRFHIISYEKIEKNSEKQKHIDWAKEQYDALDDIIFVLPNAVPLSI